MKTVEIEFEDCLVEGENMAKLAAQLREDPIVRKYLAADITIGEFGNFLNKDTEQAIEWLYDQDLPAMAKMSPGLEVRQKANREHLLNRL